MPADAVLTQILKTVAVGLLIDLHGAVGTKKTEVVCRAGVVPVELSVPDDHPVLGHSEGVSGQGQKGIRLFGLFFHRSVYDGPVFIRRNICPEHPDVGDKNIGGEVNDLLFSLQSVHSG